MGEYGAHGIVEDHHKDTTMMKVQLLLMNLLIGTEETLYQIEDPDMNGMINPIEYPDMNAMMLLDQIEDPDMNRIMHQKEDPGMSGMINQKEDPDMSAMMIPGEMIFAREENRIIEVITNSKTSLKFEGLVTVAMIIKEGSPTISNPDTEILGRHELRKHY